MKKAIAGVLVVLGMFLTPGAAVAGLHKSAWRGCFPLWSSGMFAHVCCVTTRVTAVVSKAEYPLFPVIPVFHCFFLFFPPPCFTLSVSILGILGGLLR